MALQDLRTKCKRQQKIKQECIPVGCVPAGLVWGVSAPGGWCLVWGGLPGLGGSGPGGGGGGVVVYPSMH